MRCLTQWASGRNGVDFSSRLESMAFGRRCLRNDWQHRAGVIAVRLRNLWPVLQGISLLFAELVRVWTLTDFPVLRVPECARSWSVIVRCLRRKEPLATLRLSGGPLMVAAR